MKAEARLTSSLTKLLPVASQASIGLLGSRICSRALVQSSTHPLQHGTPMNGCQKAGEAVVRRKLLFELQLGQPQGTWQGPAAALHSHATPGLKPCPCSTCRQLES